MFTPPAIASEVARHRHHDFVARADRYRLSRRVNHPSTLSVWPQFRASLLRRLLSSRAEFGAALPGRMQQSRSRPNPCEDAAVPAPMPVISDSVITLRRWSGRDASFLLEVSADPAIQRYSLSRSRPFTAAEAQEEVRDYEATWLAADALDRPSGSLVITDTGSGTPLGQCGIDGWSLGDTAQIGYWLAPKARVRGIATRAVVLLTNWLFDLGASRVFLTVVEDNDASIRVAQRAGFLLEGSTGKQSIWKGRSHEVLCFAVAADWKRRRQTPVD